MTIQYDKVANAVYMKLSETKVASTMEVNDRLIVDLDSKGNTIGIEILDASSQDALIQTIQSNVLNGIPVSISENTPALA